MDFDFLFDDRYRRAARLFGIRPERTGVEVDDDQLVARYGSWTVRTPLTNIAAVSVTGPYRVLKTIGPPRLAVTDRGVTFASNHRRGVQFDFHQPVRCIGPLRHPNLTVTVSDCDALAAAVRR